MAITLTPRGYKKQDRGDKNWHVALNQNLDLLDSELQALYDWQDAVETGSNTQADLVAGGFNDPDIWEVAGNIAELLNDAAFSLADLVAFLSVGHAPDGTNLTGSFSFNQWEIAGLINPVYFSASEFDLDGDVTGILQPGTSLEVDFAVSGIAYLHVQSRSVVAGPKTRVVVWSDELVLNEVINSVAYGVYRSNVIGAAGSPGASIRDLEDCSFEVFRYNATSFDVPDDETGGRVAKTNAGRVARVDYASGLSIRLTFASAAVDSQISFVARYLNGTLVETQTPTYDGTTGLITDYDRS